LKSPGVEAESRLRLLANMGILFLATGAYLSYIPGWVLQKFARHANHGGEGLIGSIEGVFLIFVMPTNGYIFFACLIAASLAACWICGRAEKILGRHDDGRIILDEIVGMLAASFLLPHSLKAVAVAFLLFRVFDVLKVFPCNLFEKLPGGFGVVADDLSAGVMANLAARFII
jgi:phosphatidylglycerophosphatase A